MADSKIILSDIPIVPCLICGGTGVNTPEYTTLRKFCLCCNKTGLRKRFFRPAFCHHGCGIAAQFPGAGGRWFCSERALECPTQKPARIQRTASIWRGKEFPQEMRNKMKVAAKERAARDPNSMQGRNHSEAVRKQISTKRIESGVARGARNPNWKGGVSAARRTARYADMMTPRYKDWRKQVMELGNYTCVMCGKRGGNLDADHIKPYAWFPELRYEVANGRVLCKPCHRSTFKDVCKMRKEFK